MKTRAFGGRLMATAAIGAVLSGAAAPPPARAGTLPGGATSLNEVHGDWTVRCRAEDGGKTQAPSCALSQEQENKAHRRALEISLVPVTGGGARGVILMPFGLAVTKPIQLAVDGTPIGKPRWFSTCIPAGCLVPLDLSRASVKTLSTGTKLQIEATAGNGQTFQVEAPLNGFSSAYDRTAELLK